jgi:hypothetical protein
MKKILFFTWSIIVAILFFIIGRKSTLPDSPIKKEDIKTETNPTEKGKMLAKRARDIISRFKAGSLVIILIVGFSGIAKADTMEDKKIMIAALELYAAMHAGEYQVVPVKTSISNKQHIINFEIRAAKQVFNFTQKIPVKYIKQEKAGRFFIGGFYGKTYGVFFQAHVYKWLEIFTGYNQYGIYGGTGIRF